MDLNTITQIQFTIKNQFPRCSPVVERSQVDFVGLHLHFSASIAIFYFVYLPGQCKTSNQLLDIAAGEFRYSVPRVELFVAFIFCACAEIEICSQEWRRIDGEASDQSQWIRQEHIQGPKTSGYLSSRDRRSRPPPDPCKYYTKKNEPYNNYIIINLVANLLKIKEYVDKISFYKIMF